jgi:2,5-diketo-D-gluconate reductase B
MNLPETFRALNQLVREGRVRYLGVSNFGLKVLQEAQSLSETPLLTNQVPYSIPDRSYVENGVLAYCQANDILLTAYSPVKSRFFKGKKLADFARQKGSTPFQIGLAWLVHQPRVITIPTSFNPQHQAENLAAVDMNLTADEMVFLNSLA